MTFRPASAPLRMRFVADVMREGIYTCPGSATLREVARTLSERRIHCVVISGSPDHDVWGVVSDLDLVRGAGGDLDETTAGEVAATEVVTVPPSATLEEAAQLMAELRSAACSTTTASGPVTVTASTSAAVGGRVGSRGATGARGWAVGSCTRRRRCARRRAIHPCSADYQPSVPGAPLKGPTRSALIHPP